jgi:hypothetical protein
VNVECYEEDTNEWQECASMSLFRSALSSCVIGNIPNIGSFIERPSIDAYVPHSLQSVVLIEEDSLMIIEPPRDVEDDNDTEGHLADVDSDVDMEDVV